ncbi:MAG: branched-chain amino acid transaminase [Bacteroidota bacterium]|jgi:branched-chain amino acid aminotransferase
MPLPKHAFLKDRIVPYEDAKVGLLTHALNYGTAVFGGVRGYWNDEEGQLHVFRLQDHCRRFLQSAKLLSMELPFDEQSLFQAFMDLLLVEQFHEDCYIRPLAFYSDEIIGVRLHNLHPVLGIVAIPFGRYVEKEEGTHVTVSSWRRVDDNMIPPRGKIAGAYVNSAFIKTDAQRAGFDEAIVLNQDGHVAEGSAENLFMVKNGVAVTPGVTDNILEGITRRSIITLLQDELHLTVVERQIDRSELYLADEIFFVGTGVQIASVIMIDYRPVGTGKMGNITKDLRDLYFNVVRGRVQKYRHWCCPVYKEEPVRQR